MGLMRAGQFRRQLFQPVFAARNEKKIVFGGQFPGECRPYAAGCSGDCNKCACQLCILRFYCFTFVLNSLARSSRRRIGVANSPEF